MWSIESTVLVAGAVIGSVLAILLRPDDIQADGTETVKEKELIPILNDTKREWRMLSDFGEDMYKDESNFQKTLSEAIDRGVRVKMIATEGREPQKWMVNWSQEGKLELKRTPTYYPHRIISDSSWLREEKNHHGHQFGKDPLDCGLILTGYAYPRTIENRIQEFESLWNWLH